MYIERDMAEIARLQAVNRLYKLGVRLHGRTVVIDGLMFPRWRAVELVRAIPMASLEDIMRGLRSMAEAATPKRDASAYSD